jgi:hypothetical protein
LFAFQSLVQGENCPAPIDVETRVRSILHLKPEQELNEGFIVERHEAGLYVELRSADSTLIGQRTLPAGDNCNELAQAAAVVLSTWLSDVHPDFAGVLPEPEPKAEPAPAPEPPPPPPPPPTPVVKRAPPPPAPERPWRWDFALAFGGELSGGEIAFAVPFKVGYGAAVNGFGVSVMGVATTARAEPFGPGELDWRRWPVGLGPSYRLGAASVSFDFNVGPALGWIHAAGQGFDHNFTKDGVDWGGFLDARVSSRGSLSVFGLVDAQLYPGTAGISVNGVEGSWAVPRFSLCLAVGVRFSP